MDTISVNYWAIAAGAVFSMILGFVWFGPFSARNGWKLWGWILQNWRPEIKCKNQPAR